MEVRTAHCLRQTISMSCQSCYQSNQITLITQTGCDGTGILAIRRHTTLFELCAVQCLDIQGGWGFPLSTASTLGAGAWEGGSGLISSLTRDNVQPPQDLKRLSRLLLLDLF